VHEYAKKAIELDPTLADAHTSIGAAYWLADWRWADSERELRRAVELNPGYALGRSVLGLMLISVGRADDGLAEVRRSLELDSLSMFVAVNAQWAYYYTRRFAESEAQGEMVLRINPDYESAHGGLRHAKLAQGDVAGAIPHAFALFPDSVTQVFRAGARAAVARRGARGYWEVEREATTATGLDRYWPSWMAVVEGRLANPDAAFQWMERAMAVRDGNLVFALVDPLYDELRPDPRYDAILTRMGLKPAAVPPP
jgi:serine/threonine-protein kinase